MKTDITVKQMTAVYDAVHENITSCDEPKNFGETLDDMFFTYMENGIDGSDAEFRSVVISHYRNMQRLMEELEGLLD